MDVVGKLDEHGRTAWLAVMILSFIIFWPIGLAILAYMIWSGRMGCEKMGGTGRWWNMEKRRSRHGRNGYRNKTSGNVAFDEYREETLRRLQDEQEEFVSFLDRLRQAKDKAEFDQFMADRKERGTSSDDTDRPDAPEAPATA